MSLGSIKPVFCLCGCRKFVRWAKSNESPATDHDSEHWFASRECLYKYAYTHGQKVAPSAFSKEAGRTNIGDLLSKIQTRLKDDSRA